MAKSSPRELSERVVQLLVGLFFFGFSLALMIRGAIGVAPWDVLSLGIINQLPLGFGTVTVILSFFVLLLWIPLKQRLGVGTFCNALLVGPFADIALHVLPEPSELFPRILMFAIGLVTISIATVLYISADFGPGPRDGLMTGLVARTGKPVWMMRTLIEGSVLLLGFVLGGPVGVGTVIFAFGVGPLIGLFLPLGHRLRGSRLRRYHPDVPIAHGAI